jgi:CPA2 family monovalent cation:H+ antiporter-2
LNPAEHELAYIFIELGLATIGLAILARLSSRWGFSAIPLYLLAGLPFGNDGLAPLSISRGFTHTGAEIGILLLLFMLGLEYSGDQLKQNLRSGLWGGALDLLLNFLPGLLAGHFFGWQWLPSILLGGITYNTSLGIAARVFSDSGRMNSPETSVVLSILVLEDLSMAVYLPLVAVLIAGGGGGTIAISVAIAVIAVLLALFTAIRHGHSFSALIAHQSDEVILLSVFGSVLLAAGLAERIQVSAAIGAFLVGIALSGPVAKRSQRLISPLRDLFAAIFFFFFGVEIDPRSLPPVLLFALVLAVVTLLTKTLTGYLATRRTQVGHRARLRAGFTLVAHGEFAIVIAGLGGALEPRLGPLAAAYVLLTAVLGPIAVRLAGKDRVRPSSS